MLTQTRCSTIQKETLRECCPDQLLEISRPSGGSKCLNLVTQLTVRTGLRKARPRLLHCRWKHLRRLLPLKAGCTPCEQTDPTPSVMAPPSPAHRIHGYTRKLKNHRRSIACDKTRHYAHLCLNQKEDNIISNQRDDRLDDGLNP